VCTILRIFNEYFGEIFDLTRFDGLNFFRGEPSDFLTVLPHTVFLLSALALHENTNAMLLAIIPPAGVLLLIAPCVNPVAMLLIITVETFIPAAVLPGVNAEIFHDVPFPVPDVASAVIPLIVTVTRDLILLPLPFVVSAICPDILPDSVLTAFFVFTYEFRRVRPCFSALAVL
jgi:hypothetical protein